MKNPTFDITVGAHAKDWRVLCNGQDITSCLRGVGITCDQDVNGGTTHLTLRMVSSEAQVRLVGVIETTLEARLPDTTALGDDFERVGQISDGRTR